MRRFQQVAPGILRGGAPDQKDLQLLKDVWNVKRIISLDAGVANKISESCKKLGIEHIVIPIESDTITTSINYLKRNIKSLLSTNTPVYIHCFHGKDRTGLAIALWRVANGWSCDAALREARSFGFGIGVSPRIKNIYIAAICGADISDTNDTSDIVTQVRDSLESGPGIGAMDSRHSFSNNAPAHEQYSDYHDAYSLDISQVNDRKIRRSKLRQLLLEDYNNSMAQVGVYDNCNPVLRGLGPVAPCGVLPYGNIGF